jgi:hypothetical protein
MIFYLVFNGGLYLTQVVLYASLFLLDKHGIFTDDTQDRLTLVQLISGELTLLAATHSKTDMC